MYVNTIRLGGTFPVLLFLFTTNFHVIALNAQNQQKTLDESFIVEHYYKVKWGYANEFIELFKKNHYPILKKLVEKGEIIKVIAEKPRHHNTEESRWDYKVTIIFKNAAAAFDTSNNEPLRKLLYPDKEKFDKEEQRRFEILLAHWDVPIQVIDLEK